MNNSISRIYYFLMTTLTMWSCQYAYESGAADDITDTDIPIQAASVNAAPVNQTVVEYANVYSHEFVDFLSYFSATSLPYMIGRKGLASQVIDKLPLMKKSHVVSFLDDSARVAVAGDVARYLNDNSKYIGKLNKAHVEDKSFLHYLSVPIQTREYAAVIFCADYIGLPGRTSVNGTSAVLCTFSPKGKLISSLLFAREYEGADPPYVFKNNVTGSISAKHIVEITNINTEINNDTKKTSTRRSTQKYRIKDNGTIVKVK